MSMSRLRRTLLGVLGLAGLAAGLAPAVATAPSAAAAPVYGNWEILPKGSPGVVTQSVGGWFDGLVYNDTSGNLATPYQWMEHDTWVSGSGVKYVMYAHVGTGKCLSHDGTYLFTEPCVWGDNSQWWTKKQVFLGYNPVPPGHLPSPILADLVLPYDKPTKAMTLANGLMTLTPLAGATGGAGQRFTVQQLILPH